MNSILENAVISIQLGVEDYLRAEQDHRRVVSAIRNLYAGVLLLFKEELARRSPKKYGDPPILVREKLEIKFRLNSDGSLKEKKTTKTVSFEEIKKRFKTLGIKIDWSRLRTFQDIRNNIEHYKLQQPIEDVKKAIWTILPVIRDFITDYLHEDPEKLLGAEVWQTLLKTEEVYQKELNAWLRKIIKIATEEGYLKCPFCQSVTIKPDSDIITVLTDIEFTCSRCSEKFKISEYTIEEMVSNFYSVQIYESIKYGCENPIKICSECGCNAVIYNKKLGEYTCLVCGSSFNSICERCQLPYSDEENIGICPDCYRELLEFL